MNPAQNVLPFPSIEQYFNRAANGGLTCWYSGAANQVAHAATAFTANFIYASPIILDGGILDSIAFEVTAVGAGSTARCGLYANVTDGTIYPGALLLDGGDTDTASATGVKATAINLAIPPGLYWTVFHCKATAPTIRALQLAGMNHISGLLPTMGASLSGSLLKNVGAYGALPIIYPAGGTYNSITVGACVAIHYAS